MTRALPAVLVFVLAACGSRPLTDAQAPGWSAQQAAEYREQRDLVRMMRANDPALDAAIQQRATATAGGISLPAREAQIRASVRRTMMAEDDREAEARCQAHYQGMVAPLIVALAAHVEMRAERDACVNHFRATGEMPPQP